MPKAKLNEMTLEQWLRNVKGISSPVARDYHEKMVSTATRVDLASIVDVRAAINDAEARGLHEGQVGALRVYTKYMLFYEDLHRVQDTETLERTIRSARGRRLKDMGSAFREYLYVHVMLADGTRSSYASAMSVTLKALRNGDAPATPKGLHMFFKCKSGSGVYFAAAKYLVRFLAGTGGDFDDIWDPEWTVLLASLEGLGHDISVNMGAGAKRWDISPPLEHFIWMLSTLRWPMQRVQKLTWGDMLIAPIAGLTASQKARPIAYDRHGNVAGGIWLRPIPDWGMIIYENYWDHAAPDHDGIPLIETEHRSSKPMSVVRLRRIAHTRPDGPFEDWIPKSSVERTATT